MAKTENSKTVTVYMDEEVQGRLRAMAKAIGISRNRLVLNILIIGLEEAEFPKPVVKLVALATRLKERIRNKISATGSDVRAIEVWEKPEKTKTMTIYMSNDLFVRLKGMAGITGVNKNRLIANLLTVGLEEAEALRRIGIIQVAAFARDLREKVRERIGGDTIDEEQDRAGGPRPPGLG